VDERSLGRRSVSALGLGCWAIGGAFGDGVRPWGWGEVDDSESEHAIRRGLELGVTFFDTADVYGTGNSEMVLGRAIGRERDRVVIATKFGNTFEEVSGRALASDVSPAYIRSACEASLRRLGTDWIDLYQLHISDLPMGEAAGVADTLDELLEDGLIRAYGWSTDDADRAATWADRPGCVAIQHTLNVFDDAPELLAVCEQHDLASVNRSPLAMGFLSGKFDARSHLPKDDVRASGAEWLTWFRHGRPDPELLEQLASIRELLQSGGRTLVQGALGWLWARSDRTIPIPGFKTVAQVEENARALEFGPLDSGTVAEIETLLGRSVSSRPASPQTQ
jgi:aryl-alcohol dehydrogenase-like predicted oxidoreductase